ncbi:class I SAM-dependent methyltransferase [Solitalea lacus]|uniref:class I SAM-dependent methyltransferase n=1 Tax=Solitalea lacus TaxID=2911172 RepID=UPI001EDA7029|nr:RsmD family RNA methyltransferase [Solitalea lacus]UKJ09154.1 class I SAM-dependent methyltransferase [Solitalea lacus]
MNQQEFELLKSDEARKLIDQYIDFDPLKFALSHKASQIPTGLISSQLKYLQKAKAKLPSYFAARCIIPALSYEQSSSEVTAALKKYSGKYCLDLTCGLGVDSLYFSKQFERVVSLEMNETLANITRFNFNKLNATNIELINTTAEDFISNYNGEKFDLIFVDPARRDDAQGRVFLFEDCSPDLYTILPLVEPICKKLIVKASPLFDNSEAWKRFPSMKSLTVVSVDNECKELLLEFDFTDSNQTQLNQIHISKKGIEQQFKFQSEQAPPAAIPSNDGVNYLIEPDVAFYKSRLCIELFNEYYPNLNITFDQADGYFYSQEPVESSFPGRFFRIIKQLDYQPKTIKKLLKEKGIKKANVSKRNFPYSVEEIRKTLNLSDGGNQYLFFTKNRNNELKLIWAEK